MKKLFYFLTTCIVIGLLLSIAIGSFPVFPAAGRAFLVSVQQEVYPQAYSMLSEGFQQRMDLRTFMTSVKASGLDQYESVEWIDQSGDPKQGTYTMVGVVTTKDKRKIPIKVDFAKGQPNDSLQKGWYIDALQVGASVIKEEMERGALQKKPQ